MNKLPPMGDPYHMPESLTEVRDALDFTPKRILDYGFGWGVSCNLWLKWFPEATVTCCDPVKKGEFQPERGGFAIEDLTDTYGKRWRFINKPVEDVLQTDIEPFDLIFNDADHEYDSTLEQLRLSWDKLLPGGVLCGHDYQLPGTRRALIKFARQMKLEYRLFDHDMRCWMIDPKGV